MISYLKPVENLGGYLKIWAIPHTDIIINNNSVTILSSSNIRELYCVPESIEFQEEIQLTRYGNIYDTEITAVIPKDVFENYQLLSNLNNHKWILILLDQNEQYKVSGSNDIAHRFSCKTNPGKAIADLNAHFISFHSAQIQKAFFISNPFLES